MIFNSNVTIVSHEIVSLSMSAASSLHKQIQLVLKIVCSYLHTYTFFFFFGGETGSFDREGDNVFKCYIVVVLMG